MSQISLDLTQSLNTPRPSTASNVAPAEPEPVEGSAFAEQLEEAAAEQPEESSATEQSDEATAEAGAESGASEEAAERDAERDQDEPPTGGEPNDEQSEGSDERLADETTEQAELVAVPQPLPAEQVPVVDGEIAEQSAGAQVVSSATEQQAEGQDESAGELPEGELVTRSTTANGEDTGEETAARQDASTPLEASADSQAEVDLATPSTAATAANARQTAASDATQALDSQSTDATAVVDATAGGTAQQGQTGGEQQAGQGSPDEQSAATTANQNAAANRVEATLASAGEQVAPTAEVAAETVETTNNANSNLSRIAAGRVDSQTTEATENSGPRVDAARFVSRVSGAFQAAQERGGEVRLRLSPPELGVLQIKLTVSEGVLNASLETENAAARNVLLDNLPALRERLAEQEIRVEKFDVDVRQEGGSEGQQRALEERRDSNRRQERREPPPTEAVATETATAAPEGVSSDSRINLVA